jgi:phage FluMu protein Com
MVFENESKVKVAEVHCPVCHWRIMDVEKGTKGGIQVKCPHCKNISRISLAYRLRKHTGYRCASF